MTALRRGEQKEFIMWLNALIIAMVVLGFAYLLSRGMRNTDACEEGCSCSECPQSSGCCSSSACSIDELLLQDDSRDGGQDGKGRS